MTETDASARLVAEALAEVMRSRRRAAGLNQTEMADKVGIDPKHYQAMENGFVSYRDRKPANPQLDKLVKLAHGFETTVPDLMSDVFSRIEIELG